MTDRSWDELEQLNESGDYGTSWTPTKDPEHPNPLAGTVRGYEQSSTEFEHGLRPWIVKVEDRHGQLWSVWLFGTVLLAEFTAKRPDPGERIVLRYVGESDNPKPGRRPAHIYRLTVDREALASFLAAPQLGAADEDGPDLGFKPHEQEPARADAEVADADVVDVDDDDIPF